MDCVIIGGMYKNIYFNCHWNSSENCVKWCIFQNHWADFFAFYCVIYTAGSEEWIVTRKNHSFCFSVISFSFYFTFAVLCTVINKDKKIACQWWIFQITIFRLIFMKKIINWDMPVLFSLGNKKSRTGERLCPEVNMLNKSPINVDVFLPSLSLLEDRGCCDCYLGFKNTVKSPISGHF